MAQEYKSSLFFCYHGATVYMYSMVTTISSDSFFSNVFKDMLRLIVWVDA